MIPLIPVLVSALPTLIKTAESIFSKKEDGVKTGPQKHEFVKQSVLTLYDIAKAIKPDLIPSVLTREFLSDVLDVTIKHLVAQGIQKS